MTLQRPAVLYGFAGTGALLAALLVYQIAAPLPELDAPLVRLKPRIQPMSSVVAVATPAPEAFAVIAARPMFSPGRRGAPAEGSASAQAPDIALVGIIVDRDTRLALIKTQTSPLATAYRIGATISGWQVSEIGPDRIVITAGPARNEIRLEANRAPPKPPNLSNSQ